MSMKQENQTIPSKHCFGTLWVKDAALLTDMASCEQKVSELIIRHGAHQLGSTTHTFENGSFTLLLSLSESHISIHTWPEHQNVQLDVFLCSYLEDNSKKCQKIFDEICQYFQPTKTETQSVMRA